MDETKTGEVLELPITRQLAAIFERRGATRKEFDESLSGSVFPSELSRTGHVVDVQAHNAVITEAGGEKFWFQGCRNSFNSVAEREFLLPRSLAKRLVNHARPHDVTEDHAVEQLREPANAWRIGMTTFARCPCVPVEWSESRARFAVQTSSNRTGIAMFSAATKPSTHLIAPSSDRCAPNSVRSAPSSERSAAMSSFVARSP